MHERVIAVLAALAGLFGVALSAAAAHVAGGDVLDIAARFLLVHAAALLALAGLVRCGVAHAPIGTASGYVLALGLVLFCGDLTVRAFLGERLFAFAAPAGGFALMLGWALVGLAGLLGRGRA